MLVLVVMTVCVYVCACVCVCVCACVCVLVFLDINPSSWRQGDALVRQILGPMKHAGRPHSPPTRDTLKHDGPSESESQLPVDVRCRTDADRSVPSPPQDNDVHSGELEQNSVDNHRESVTAWQIGCLSNNMDEETVESKDGAESASENLQSRASVGPRDWNVVDEPGIHHDSIKLPGNLHIICDLIEACYVNNNNKNNKFI